MPPHLVTLIDGPGWHRDSLCREYPDVNFFPERGEDAQPARAICAVCLVAPECLAYALDEHVEHGAWAGTTGRERRRLRWVVVEEEQIKPGGSRPT
jgi:WhiB family redox-sensing transcriptional regulator